MQVQFRYTRFLEQPLPTFQTDLDGDQKPASLQGSQMPGCPADGNPALWQPGRAVLQSSGFMA